MTTNTILFVDNDLDFLTTRAEYLVLAGYRVLTANSLIQANKVLLDPNIRLVILDIRLENDDDEWDTSGLGLAEQISPSIPKIIMTGYPTQETVRAMLKVRPNGMPIATDYVAKDAGPEALIVSISKIMNMLELSNQYAKKKTLSRQGNNKDVFIVHGHDEASRQEVARFIERIGLTAIILSEQITGGRTIMEQLERYSDVSFAIVLLTPDDVGYAKDKKPKNIPYRARQNVIFELGYFIGCLTRERVRTLYKEGVEILSDYHGVIYIPMDTTGGWKGKIAKELEEAGFLIDINKLRNAL